jgi:hypothetical protein
MNENIDCGKLASIMFKNKLDVLPVSILVEIIVGDLFKDVPNPIPVWNEESPPEPVAATEAALAVATQPNIYLYSYNKK